MLKLKQAVPSRASSQAFSQRPSEPQSDWKARASLDRVLLHQNGPKLDEAPPTGRNSHLSRRYQQSTIALPSYMQTLHEVTLEQPKKRKRRRVSYATKTPEAPVIVHKSVDYLAVQRVKRSVMPKEPSQMQFEQLLSKATGPDRIEMVRRHAENLEMRAFREEQLMRHDMQSGDVDRVISVNDRYIDAINAKLKLLDQI